MKTKSLFCKDRKNMKTIIDAKTNLEWLIQDFKPMTWDETIKFAIVRGNNWRIPTIEELLSIIDRRRQEPTCDSAHGLGNNSYWADSKYNCNINNAWRIDFINGNIYYSDKDDYFYVHYVKSI